jgi:hypothetical protein
VIGWHVQIVHQALRGEPATADMLAARARLPLPIVRDAVEQLRIRGDLTVQPGDLLALRERPA